MLNKISIILSIFSVFVLSLIIPGNLYIYGIPENNQSLEYKYGNATERTKMDYRSLYNECVEYGSKPFGQAIILFVDKCKPIIKDYEMAGFYVSDFQKSLNDQKEDTIKIVRSHFTSDDDCLFEDFKEHILLFDSDKCQRVTEYYLNNGYDLVDKYDKKVELIQRQNSSQVNP
jgi:hypothetical protein